MAEKTGKIKVIKAVKVGDPDPKYGNQTWVITEEKGTMGHFWGKYDWEASIGEEVDVLIDTEKAKGAAKYQIKIPGQNKGFGGKSFTPFNPTPDQQIRIAALGSAVSSIPLMQEDPTGENVIALAKTYEQYIKG
jgi:hypothetical protein